MSIILTCPKTNRTYIREQAEAEKCRGLHQLSHLSPLKGWKSLTSPVTGERLVPSEQRNWEVSGGHSAIDFPHPGPASQRIKGGSGSGCVVLPPPSSSGIRQSLERDRVKKPRQYWLGVTLRMLSDNRQLRTVIATALLPAACAGCSRRPWVTAPGGTQAEGTGGGRGILGVGIRAGTQPRNLPPPNNPSAL